MKGHINIYINILSKTRGVDFMKVTVIGKNINVTPALKEMVEKKISKLDRYFSPDIEARATLTVQKQSNF